MIMANDKQNTSPNVPNKREQSGIYSGYAERGVLRPQGNVPNLRFPEFSGEWRETKLKDVCDINPKTVPLNDVFLYIDLESVVKGKLVKRNYISKQEAPSRAQRVLTRGDILYQCVRPYQLNNYFVGSEDSLQMVASTGYAQIRTKQSPEFIYHLLHTKSVTNQVLDRCTGSNYPAINSSDLATIGIKLPSKEEQCKVATILSLLDKRIDTQNKIIEQLQSLIKGIRVSLFNFDGYNIKYLGELCSITTGKLDANAMVENGKYPFFTCAEETFRIDEYAFDTEALLISGNGANLGYIHYYNGKFNAYQRTYVLDKFYVEVMYLKYYLETFLNQRINQEVNVGNTPYIVLSTLTKMKIKIPDILIQQRIVTTMKSLKEKLLNENLALRKDEEQKKFLLSNMFI